MIENHLQRKNNWKPDCQLFLSNITARNYFHEQLRTYGNRICSWTSYIRIVCRYFTSTLLLPLFLPQLYSHKQPHHPSPSPRHRPIILPQSLRKPRSTAVSDAQIAWRMISDWMTGRYPIADCPPRDFHVKKNAVDNGLYCYCVVVYEQVDALKVNT